MKVDELIGSLQNFEITINNKSDKKGMCIAFVSNFETDETKENHEDDENLSESLVLLGRQFKKIFKQVDKRSRCNGHNIGQNIRSNIDNQPSK